MTRYEILTEISILMAEIVTIECYNPFTDENYRMITECEHKLSAYRKELETIDNLLLNQE